MVMLGEQLLRRRLGAHLHRVAIYVLLVIVQTPGHQVLPFAGQTRDEQTEATVGCPRRVIAKEAQTQDSIEGVILFDTQHLAAQDFHIVAVIVQANCQVIPTAVLR